MKKALPALTALVAAIALATGLFAAGHAVERSPDPLPRLLSETRLYEADGRVAADVLTFAPQYPLWTDGATKARWIRLPEGAVIDARNPDVWEFPVGTQVWKEFSFGRRVETRYMQRGADGWRFGAYLWNPEGTDAVLVPKGAQVDRGDGGRHDVPNAFDCLICHDNGASPVLGFSTLQLSPDRDPGALHVEPPSEGDVDLATLVAAGLLVGLPDDLVSAAPRIEARTPTERAALGYLHGNCGGCHDATGPLAPLGMDLRWSVEDPAGEAALVTTLGRSSRAALPSDPTAPRVRVVPGHPDGSVLLGRMGSRSPTHQMPPLGTAVVDDEAVTLIATWIAESSSEEP